MADTSETMRAFGASDEACSRWPDDTPEHKALRAAFIAGAIAAAGCEQCEPLRAALEPFAVVGQWLFARPVPDEDVLVQFDGINNYNIKLSRGQFKAAHLALRRTEQETPIKRRTCGCHI